jgi:hypothetical protein
MVVDPAGRELRVIAPYGRWWVVVAWAPHEYELVEQATAGFSPLPAEKREYEPFKRDEPVAAFPETGQLSPMQSLHVYVQEWGAREHRMRCRANVRGALQALGIEVLHVLPDSTQRCDPFYLQEAERLSHRFLNGVQELREADEQLAGWSNLWSRADRRVRVPNMIELVRPFCVSR